VAGRFLSRTAQTGQAYPRVAIAGTGEAAQEVFEEIEQFGGEEIQLAGYIACPSGEPPARIPIIGSLDTLERTLQEHRIDDLILAPDSSGHPEPMEWIVRCERVAPSVRVRLHSDLAGLYAGRVALTDLAGLPLVEIPDRWRCGWQLVLKRTLDIAAATAGLILILLPGLAVALAIALEGLFRPVARGPVFFCQERIGRNRIVFRLVKFRTMISSAEAGSGPILAIKNDPRITRIGRILRRSGIDELPQLWNVLKGEMSLVGPRPERPEFTEQLLNEHPYYELRLRMRPGITGLAQIHGHYHSPVSSKLRYDIVYLSNFSLLLDLKILFRTLQVILTGKKIEGR
jgi:exopolysaccharide biosynthesis polyprenyl glycosylphosphotransferase